MVTRSVKEIRECRFLDNSAARGQQGIKAGGVGTITIRVVNLSSRCSDVEPLPNQIGCVIDEDLRRLEEELSGREASSRLGAHRQVEAFCGGCQRNVSFGLKVRAS